MIGAYLKKNLVTKTLKQSLEGKVSCQRKQFTVLDQFHVTIRRFEQPLKIRIKCAL